MPSQVQEETGFLTMWWVLTTQRFVRYYCAVYKNETHSTTPLYVEFKERKIGCGTHCTELIWRSEGDQENWCVWTTQYTLTKKCCLRRSAGMQAGNNSCQLLSTATNNWKQ
jgi:hypothetical protein